MKADVYLFDWDNTLVDTWPNIHAAFNVMMQEMGREPWSFEMTKANIKHSMREAFPEMFGDEWQRAADAYQKAYRAVHLDNLCALPDAQHTLQQLRAQGKKIAAVSNKRGPTLRLEVAHMGWDRYFDAIIGAGDAARDKPHPDPAEMALEHMQQRKGSHVCFIGDTVVDLECGNAIGAQCVLYGDVQTDGNIYQGSPFAHHVRDHASLMHLLKIA